MTTGSAWLDEPVPRQLAAGPGTVLVVDGEPAPAVMWVRFLPGVVGLTRRVVHMVPVPVDGVVPERLIAYCGQPIRRGVAELLAQPVGAPCELCLLQWWQPVQTELPV
jgi:hypothetical protein